MILEILKHKRHVSASAAQIFVKTVSVVSVSVASESSHSLYDRDQSLSVINADE